MGAESNAGLLVAPDSNDEITLGRRLFQDEKDESYANMRKKSLSTPLIFTCTREITAINTCEIFEANPNASAGAIASANSIHALN